MYERIDKNLSEEAGKFVLPNMDVNQALALLQSWDVEESSEREEQRETEVLTTLPNKQALWYDLPRHASSSKTAYHTHLLLSSAAFDLGPITSTSDRDRLRSGRRRRTTGRQV